MKTLPIQFKTLILIFLVVFGFSNSYSQTISNHPIPSNFFGTNYWYFEETGNFNPAVPYANNPVPDPSEYEDYFYDKIPSLTAGGIKIVRIGGSKFNKDWVTDAYWGLYEVAIDNVAGMGATPLLQIPIDIIKFELDATGYPSQPLTFTQVSIDNVQAWVDHFNNTKQINNWCIGNEPDPSSSSTTDFLNWMNGGYREDLDGDGFEETNTYEEFKTKFIKIAEIIKATDPTDIVAGPDFRHFWGTSTNVNTPLGDDSYYKDFIETVGTATTAGNVPLLDIFAFHFYGYTMTPDKASQFQTVKGYIDAANANPARAGSILSFAMGEVNANPNCDPLIQVCEPFPWDFEAGQFLAFCAKNIMKYSGAYFTPWSVFENSGSRGVTDYSLYDPDTPGGTRVPRSTMWHLAALAQNWRANYMDSDLKFADATSSTFTDKICVVGMTDPLGSTLMIMNTTSSPCKYSIRLHDNAFAKNEIPPALPDNVKIKVRPTTTISPIQGTPNLVHRGTIPGNSTIVYIFNPDGSVVLRDPAAAAIPCTYIYTDGGTPSVLNPALRVASVNANASNPIVGKDEVNLYPVPTSGNLNVDNATNYKSIQIYNNVGQVVYTISNLNQSKVRMDLSRLAPGIYYMHLNGDSKRVVKKLIKH
jgi:hypothetical protein